MKIRSSQETPKGKYLEVDCENQLVQIIFTWHSLDAIKDYEMTLENILNFLLYPEEVVKGHANRYIAHRRLNHHLARVVYEYNGRNVIVITFYISYVNRYFREGKYEDKILS
jgi:hypothetical protein